MSDVRKCRYLTGENIAPKTPSEAKALIGVHVEYLLERDIDKSGRGYFFPRIGSIEGVTGRNVAFDSPLNFIATLKDIREMVKK